MRKGLYRRVRWRDTARSWSERTCARCAHLSLPELAPRIRRIGHVSGKTNKKHRRIIDLTDRERPAVVLQAWHAMMNAKAHRSTYADDPVSGIIFALEHQAPLNEGA